jgi:DHA2 family multidrug resistance protein-like MFS transporter
MAPALPAGLAAPAREAAGQTLGGALAVAGQLPARAGSALVDVAREAFTAGMAVASWAGAALMLVTAAVCWMTVRRAAPVTAPLIDSAGR